MNEIFKKNIENIFNIFNENEDDAESKYLTIIKLGRNLPILENKFKTPENKIEGCQSTTYIYSFFENGKIYFKANSDALISLGLAALLILAYDGQSPNVIINNPPEFIKDLGIHASLSLNRSNGLAQIYLRMKQDALKYQDAT
jgi:cysteine desulfuration protein SufE